MDRVGIDDLDPVGDQRLRWKHDRIGLEGRIERVGVERRGDGPDHRLGVGVLALRARDERTHHQFLHRFEAGEGVGIALREPLELARLAIRSDDDRR